MRFLAIFIFILQFNLVMAAEREVTSYESQSTSGAYADTGGDENGPDPRYKKLAEILGNIGSELICTKEAFDEGGILEGKCPDIWPFTRAYCVKECKKTVKKEATDKLPGLLEDIVEKVKQALDNIVQ